MIYRVVLDDTIDIHTSDINCMLLNPSIELEMNSAGSFTFTLPPTHPNWDDIRVLKSTIDVYENNELIFTGRVASIEKNWNNERVVKCEGALAYFNDSIHRQMKWETPLPIASEDPEVHNFLKDILDNHNVFEGSENLNRHIYIGHIYVDTELVTREVDYDTTLDILTRMCIDTNGGYFQIRKDPDDGKLYLDWLKDFTDESSQPASFGLNLLDFNTSLSAEDICTGVLARGATVNDQVVTLNDVELVDETTYPDYSVTHYTDHDQDILWHREGVATFGQVVQVKDFSDAQTAWKDQSSQIVASSLFEVAKKWLEEKNTKVETIEVEVAELNWLGEGYPQFKLGQIVEVIDSVHMSGESEATRLLPMYKMSCDLTNGSKKVTLGTPPKKELTQISASNSDSSTLSSTSSSGSSGGGSGSGEECKVHDVRVDGTSVVSNKVANINLTGKADVSTVNALAATVAQKANTSTVTALANVVAGKQNQIEFNTAEAATETLTRIKADGIVYNLGGGTEVEANPSETATDDLTTIKIGDTVYDIPGGSGGSGQDYECDLLFENTNGTLPGTSSALFATLSESISDYDALFIETSLYYNGDFHQAKPLIIFKPDYNFANSDENQFIQDFSGDYRLYLRVYDETHIYAYRTTNSGFGADAMTIAKVYGLKFASNVINNQYLSDYYSTEERVVGRWTDGKPLYQKTFTKTFTGATSNWVLFDDSVSYDKLINILTDQLNTNGEVLPILQDKDASPRFRSYNNVIDYYTTITGSVAYAITLQYTKTTDAAGTGPTPGNLIYLPSLYSEEEREIGVWVDGKPLYQKTINCGALPNATMKEISSGLTNEKIVNMFGYSSDGNAETFVLPHVITQTGSNLILYQIQLYYNYSSHSICIRTGVDRSAYTETKITLQYTKTTDTAGSGKYLPDGQYAHHYSTSEKVVGTWIDGSTIYEKTINISESDFTKTNNWFWQYNYETVLPSPYTLVGIDGSATITFEGYKHIVKLGGETYLGNNTDNCAKFVNYYRNIAFKAYPYNNSYMNFSSSARNLKILNCQLTLRYTKSS